MMAPDGSWVSGGLELAILVVGMLLWAWVVIAPMIITKQLSEVNRKLQQLLDRETQHPGAS